MEVRTEFMMKFLIAILVIVAFAMPVQQIEAAYMVGSVCADKIVDAREFINDSLKTQSPSDFAESLIWVLGDGPYLAKDVFYQGWGTTDPENCPVAVFGYQDKDRVTAPEAPGDSAGNNTSDSTTSD
jgi:hypothetical protein